MLVATVFWLQETRLAQEHVEQCLSFYDPQQHRSQAFVSYGWDPGVASLSYGAVAWWLLGWGSGTA